MAGEELEFLSLIGLMLSVILRTRKCIRDLDDEAQLVIKESRERCEALRRACRRRYRRRRAAMVRRMLQETAIRRIWKHSRPSGEVFWSNALKNFGDEEWYQHFRMSRRTFNYLLSLVRPVLARKTTNWRRPYEPSLRLAVVIWWYATPSEYRTISCLFGVGMSTVCVFLREVTSALKDRLLERFISLPKLDQLQVTMDGFAARGYPMCGGAIDGSHIPIIAPKDDPASYHNRKGWHSIVLQAVVDHRFW
nr:uncharacterized protein LOC129162260 [Nothobranchius furzeri]